MKQRTINIEVTIEATDKLALKKGYFSVTKVVVDKPDGVHWPSEGRGLVVRCHEVEPESSPSTGPQWNIYSNDVNGLFLEYGVH